jgi:hypothetical protein
MRKQPSVIRCGRPLASLLTLAVAFWAGVAMAERPHPGERTAWQPFP